MDFPCVNILGVSVSAVTMKEAADAVARFMDGRSGALVATANAEMIMCAQSDGEFRKILNGADLVVADGAGTVWAAHYLGEEMPERVAGYDLVQELLARAPGAGRGVYFFGSAPGIADRAAENAVKKYPGLKIAGVRNGFFSPDEEAKIADEISNTHPDLLLVALGSPKQEKWLEKYRAKMDFGAAIGVGGTFDVMAGAVRRAPLWMQRAKLEWLFRGLSSPKRITRLAALPKFVIRVMNSKK